MSSRCSLKPFTPVQHAHHPMILSYLSPLYTPTPPTRAHAHARGHTHFGQSLFSPRYLTIFLNIYQTFINSEGQLLQYEKIKKVLVIAKKQTCIAMYF
jgi:hypothetical protein